VLTHKDLISIEQIDPTDKKLRKEFVSLPFDLHTAHPHWHPGLRMYYDDLLNPKKNPFWKEQKFELLLARKDGKACGRMGFLYPGYFKEDKNAGVIIMPDFTDDKDVFTALLAEVESRLMEQECSKIIGPLNPNIHYDVGVQFSGFEFSNTAFMGYQPGYYSRFFEASGFISQADFYSWELNKNSFTGSEALKNWEHRLTANPAFKLRKVRLKDYSNELRLFYELYSKSFVDHWAFVAPGFDEFKFIAGDLKYILKEELALIAEWKGQPIGFVLGIPNIYEAIDRKAMGKLTPASVLHLLRHRKKIKTVRVMIAGVLAPYRNIGIHIPLFMQVARNIFSAGYEGGQIAWVMDDNKDMTKILSGMGAVRQSGYRIYAKDIVKS
jgi:hypothetical protein